MGDMLGPNFLLVGRFFGNNPTRCHYPKCTADVQYIEVKNENKCSMDSLGMNEHLVGGFNPPENISQLGNLPQIGVNIKNI